MEKEKKSVLFVCIENSSRSQMAEGFANQLGLNAESAGTFPSTHVNPLVIQAMLEKGIDLTGKIPKLLTPELVQRADVVVLTDFSIESAFPKSITKKMKSKVVRWSIQDPQKEPIEGIRVIRDEVESQVKDLAARL
jgi:protein-tyrosine-phosphatase